MRCVGALQFIDKSKVPNFGADKGRVSCLSVIALLAIVNVDIALSWLLPRVEDCEEDVLGLEVAVDDVLSMKVLDSFKDGEKEADRWERVEAVLDLRVFVVDFFIFERLQ